MTLSSEDLTGQDHWVCYPGEIAIDVARTQKVIEETLARLAFKRLIELVP